MDSTSTIVRIPTVAIKMSRLLAVLALAVALLASPAFSPEDASARRMSERTASRACSNAGGSMHYDFEDSDFSSYSMTCSLPSGASFSCGTTGGPFGNIVNCN